jgi:hypothetical protein
MARKAGSCTRITVRGHIWSTCYLACFGVLTGHPDRISSELLMNETIAYLFVTLGQAFSSASREGPSCTFHCPIQKSSGKCARLIFSNYGLITAGPGPCDKKEDKFARCFFENQLLSVFMCLRKVQQGLALRLSASGLPGSRQQPQARENLWHRWEVGNAEEKCFVVDNGQSNCLVHSRRTGR